MSQREDKDKKFITKHSIVMKSKEQYAAPEIKIVGLRSECVICTSMNVFDLHCQNEEELW